MQEDLQGLEITDIELQKITNLPVNYQLKVLIHPLKIIGRQFLEKLKGSEGATAFFIAFSLIVFSYVLIELFVELFASWITIPSWIVFISFLIVTGFTSQLLLYLIWRVKLKKVKNNITPSLKVLLKDVERYNGVIRAIDINDQIEAAGNPEVTIKERHRVIEALKLTKADLIRALKTEKILRENKKFIINNAELFASNLATLTAMQVTEKASEHGRLLNEALQIALDVQHEMRQLQAGYWGSGEIRGTRGTILFFYFLLFTFDLFSLLLITSLLRGNIKEVLHLTPHTSSHGLERNLWQLGTDSSKSNCYYPFFRRCFCCNSTSSHLPLVTGTVGRQRVCNNCNTICEYP